MPRIAARSRLPLLALLCASAQLAAAEPAPCLAVGVPRELAFAAWGRPVAFCLSGLAPHRSYEIKVSVPASTPTLLRLAVRQEASSSSSSSSGLARRHHGVDDADEKIIFHTDAVGRLDARGAVPAWAEPGPAVADAADADAATRRLQLLPHLVLVAEPQSIAHSGGGGRAEGGLRFSVVLDGVALGVIPHRMLWAPAGGLPAAAAVVGAATLLGALAIARLISAAEARS